MLTVDLACKVYLSICQFSMLIHYYRIAEYDSLLDFLNLTLKILLNILFFGTEQYRSNRHNRKETASGK